jgi:hypothetical protein
MTIAAYTSPVAGIAASSCRSCSRRHIQPWLWRHVRLHTPRALVQQPPLLLHSVWCSLRLCFEACMIITNAACPGPKQVLAFCRCREVASWHGSSLRPKLQKYHPLAALQSNFQEYHPLTAALKCCKGLVFLELWPEKGAVIRPQVIWRAGVAACCIGDTLHSASRCFLSSLAWGPQASCITHA